MIIKIKNHLSLKNQDSNLIDQAYDLIKVN